MIENEMLAVYEALYAVLKVYEPQLVVIVDKPGKYYLETTHIMQNKQPLHFGGVQQMKNYVSFHLMPVYGRPALLETISPELRARMQGKACFNFKRVQPELFAELARLTQVGFDHYKAADLL